MSSFVSNCSISVGAPINEEKSFIKFKIGRGEQEGEALRQLVKSGTGKDHSENLLPLYLRFGNTEANTPALVEYLKNFDQSGPSEEHEAVNGQRWMTVDLAKDPEQPDNLVEIFNQQTKAFDDLKSNACLEFGYRSAEDLQGVNYDSQDEIQKMRTEGDKCPSYSKLFRNFSTTFSSDIDSETIREMIRIGIEFGFFDCQPPGFRPMLADVFEKLNGLELNQSLEDFVESSVANRLFNMDNICAPILCDNEEGPLMGKILPPGCLEDMRVLFFLNKDTYLDLQMYLPGYAKWIAGRPQA